MLRFLAFLLCYVPASIAAALAEGLFRQAAAWGYTEGHLRAQQIAGEQLPRWKKS